MDSTSRDVIAARTSNGMFSRTDVAPESGVKSSTQGVECPSALRPFFGYYGGKWKNAVKHYPVPSFSRIVEPFAGSAGYSLRYADREVVLCEIDPILAAVWKYLIAVKPKEILDIPDFPSDGDVEDLKICQEAKWLVGFWLNRGVTSPRRSPSRWMKEGVRPGSFWGERVRRTIASQVDAIRHWKVYNVSYLQCPLSKAATWFVDPPYEVAGRHYRFGSSQINYSALAEWCKSRPGQVIVCENDGANWLPFMQLADVKTTRRDTRSEEVYWHRPAQDELVNTLARKSSSPKKVFT